MVFHRFDIHRGRRGYDDFGKTATEAILWLHCNLPPRPRGLFRSIASYSVTVSCTLHIPFLRPLFQSITALFAELWSTFSTFLWFLFLDLPVCVCPSQYPVNTRDSYLVEFTICPSTCAQHFLRAPLWP